MVSFSRKIRNVKVSYIYIYMYVSIFSPIISLKSIFKKIAVKH